MLICIDPGHGGNDPGAISKNGMFKEKDNVLNIAKEIVKNSYRLPGVDFLLTRQSDINFSYVQSEDLQVRCDIANQAKADFFISIHQNADKNYQGQGIETYSLATTGEGRKLAEKVQSVLTEKTNLHNRGVKTANYQVLRNTNMPAILIEAGFVGGNLDEAVYISKFETIKLFAECILQGIANYLGVNLKEENMSKFKDLDKCWYPDLALKAVDLGLVGGIQKGDGLYLDPKAPLTREQGWLVDLRQHEINNHIMDVPAMVKRYMPSIVRIWSKTEDGKSQTIGSGSFISPNVILTNAHVVGTNTYVSVDTNDYRPNNNKMQGKVIKKDEYIDLALVKIEKQYTPLTLSKGAIHGEFCIVLGNPGGEWQSVTLGIVAHPDRGDYIETDARINPGNSGGAVLNEKGELIGVPSHKITLPGFDNQNYAIRVERVKEFIKGVV